MNERTNERSLIYKGPVPFVRYITDGTDGIANETANSFGSFPVNKQEPDREEAGQPEAMAAQELEIW